jgi:uridine kinase
MARWQPARRDVIDSLADEILHNYAHGRVLVAVDGPDGSGTAEFGADLAELLGKRGHAAFHARIEDFQAPREQRYPSGSDPARGRYQDGYDYSAFRRVLIEPFQMAVATGFVLAFWDARRDQPIEPKWLTAPDDAVLVVSGVYLQRPELRGLFHYAIWLEVPVEDDADLKLYRKAVKAPEAANAIIDNRDPDHPRRIFADSC